LVHFLNWARLYQDAVVGAAVVACATGFLSAQERSGTVCFPPAWGGIVAGITEDRDVVTLHGRGLLSGELGHGGGRYYSDPQRRMTMVVEIGVDNVIESVSIESGQHGPPNRRVALPISRRLDVGEGFGVFHKLKLGSTEAEVRANLGEASKIVPGSGGATWFYQTDYVNTECFADAETRIVFAQGRVTRVVFYNGE